MKDAYSQRKGLQRMFLLALVLFIVLFFYAHQGRRRAVPNIPDPVQTEASGQEQIELDGYQITIQYLYQYDICGLVVSTHNYPGSGIGDKLAPRDIALAWGSVAAYNDSIDFHWRQSGRWYSWQAASYAVLEPVGGVEGVTLQSSNNHVIPADKTVKKAVKQIRTGDYIRLTGYLVRIDGTRSDGSTFLWQSSTVRSDTGAGSCEVVYVTGVEWLD
ncbi:MAG: hypothetical protein IJ801_10545 [Lachnospiraceae bacterium]|nr:hypothetical protein [Lachnospiraceae bacterium]